MRESLTTTLMHTLEELRSSFDRSFQEPIARPAEAPLLLLAIRVANGAFALRVDELAAVSRIEKIVPIPCHTAALSGFTGIGGGLVAVYSLAVLLGYSQAGNQFERWVVLCREQPAVGIAFSQIEGNLLLPRSDLRPSASGAPRYAVASIGSGTDARWVLSVADIWKFLAGVHKEG